MLENHPHFQYHDLDKLGRYCIMLNGRQVIISKFPKSYGTRVNGAAVGHPTRKTIILLKDMIKDFKEYG